MESDLSFIRGHLPREFLIPLLHFKVTLRTFLMRETGCEIRAKFFVILV